MNINELPLEIRFRFVRDFNLPFPIVENPYFSYYVTTLSTNAKLNINQKLQWLDDDLILSNMNYGEYLLSYHNAKNSIWDYITGHKDYQFFNSDAFDLAKYDVPVITSSKKGNIYNDEYINQTFISIDLIEANYQALSMISKDLVFGNKQHTPDFEEFVSYFTNLNTIKHSKQIRQQILGKLNQKRMIKLEKFAIYRIYKYLTDELCVDTNNLCVSNKDELVFSAKDESLLSNIDNLSDIIFKKLGYRVRVEAYTLKKILDKKMYMKVYGDGSYDLKNVPVTYYMQVAAYLESRPISNMDLAFTYDGQIAQFQENMFHVSK